MRILNLCLFIVILFNTSGLAQVENFKDEFCLPLKIVPVLTGNFGEPRATHFHSGIDFRTYTEGKEVVSIADGYVSRIYISPWGLGHAIFITHYNGYTSVYGHLSKFEPDIQKFARSVQYANQSFSIDTVLPPDLFIVRKSQIIAYSGNTGRSEGQHLHLEVRETKSKLSVNTITSVYDFKDDISPEVYSVVVYPLSDNARVDGLNNKKQYKTVAIKSGTYSLVNNISPKVYGDVGIGVAYIDKMNDTHNKFGAENVKLYVNDSLFYHSRMDKVDFAKQKCKNSMFDYYYYLEKQHVHKTFVEPNNDLVMFDSLINNGVFSVNKGENKNVKIEIVDYNGNVSIVDLKLQGDTKEYEPQVVKKARWDVDNVFLFDAGRVEVDSASLFYDTKIEIKNKGQKRFSNLYQIGEERVAIKSNIKVSLYLNEEALKYKNKLFIYRIHNKTRYALKTSVCQNFALANSDSFGEFYVDVDTIPPQIQPVNIFQGANMAYKKCIEIQISDDLSRVKQYDLYINDKWVLGEYEPKNKSVKYYFDENMPNSNKYIFKAVVVDIAGNKAETTYDFYR
jgi:murein DD-endopeptidase MepM/ murein hydrolase activator NlpD